MLPDLPQIKQRLLKVQMRFVEWAASAQMPAFGDCPKYEVFEGDQHGIERATGDKEINPFVKVGVEIATAPHKDDLETTFAKLYEMGGQFAEKRERYSFEYLGDLMNRFGQTVDGENKKLTPDKLLEAYSRIDFPLGVDGKLDLSGFRIVASPDAHRAYEDAIKELQSNPEKLKKFDQRFQEIIKQKEEAARAREADRKLVG